MKKITDYKIRIGDKLDYVEYNTDDRMPVIISDIMFDGFVFLISFKHENVFEKASYGVTEHPDKLQQRLKQPTVIKTAGEYGMHRSLNVSSD